MRPLIDGATYFRELHERLEATRDGDLVLFTDWQGDADELLVADDPDSEVVEVLGPRRRARRRRARADLALALGQARLLRPREPHPRRAAPATAAPRRCSTCGCATAARTTRSSWSSGTATTRPATSPTSAASTWPTPAATTPTTSATRSPSRSAEEYGDHPPWHDVQVAITGPAVHDVETVFRERWEDPTPAQPAARCYWLARQAAAASTAAPTRCPTQQPPPPPVEGGTHVVQLLRTYPNLRQARDYPFARGGERSVARGLHQGGRSGRGG